MSSLICLLSAEMLFYPAAIGSEPHDKTISSRDHWQRVQQSHAGATLTNWNTFAVPGALSVTAVPICAAHSKPSMAHWSPDQ